MAMTLMTCYARSGGTLLNRCIGRLPGVVILSELHPLGGGTGKDGLAFRTVSQQARHWYGITLKHEGFVDAICELHDHCQASGLRLVLRDWVAADFLPHRFNHHEPSWKLTTLNLLRERLEVHPFAFTRDSIDVWLSRGRPDPEAFFEQYVRYARAIVEAAMPIVQYEAFCRSPEQQMQRICEIGGLPYSPSFRDYQSFTHVNGDIQLARPSRGRQQGGIAPLPRRGVPSRWVAAVEACPQMIEANRLLNYPTRVAQTWPQRWRCRGATVMRRLMAAA